MRLLVVEDERGIANFLKEGLEEEGYAVDVAANGTVGLAMASENAYDLLLLDWMLPGLSGIEVCRRIRKADQEIPIIFLDGKRHDGRRRVRTRNRRQRLHQEAV